MPEKIIITGVNGFVGEHAVDTFKESGFTITGVAHDKNPNIRVSNKLDSYISCNLLDQKALTAIDLKHTRAIIHLAGLSAVGQSFEQPHHYISDNASMTYNLLDHANSNSFSGRIVVISTGALYDPHQELPFSEESRVQSNSPYAIGKLATEHVVDYFHSRGLDTVTVRPFNHIGPGQREGFILPDLYNQLAHSEASDVVRVGNITTRRDYTDVRDIVRAYKDIALAATLKYSLYNICSGKSLSGEEILSLLKVYMYKQSVVTEIDNSKLRPNDTKEIIGSAIRLQEELGWHPGIPINQTIKDFINSKR